MAARLSAVVIVAASLSLSAQILDLKPSRMQHAAFTASTGVSGVAPGGTIPLRLDVIPKPTIHIYGPGAKGYLPIALTIAASPAIKPGRAVYPKPQIVFFPALNESTPVYSQPFRVTQPVSVSRDVKPGEMLTITGLVDYQACDDSLCYPPSKATVTWTIPVTSAGL
jgi:hypothetical protein